MKNKAFVQLSKIPERFMTLNDLTRESKMKLLDTAAYAMDANNETSSVVIPRVAPAILAEQYVAEWMNGWVMAGDENTEDPYTFAFDVLSGPEWYGMRIEVKTHQSGAKYITVHTGHNGKYPGNTGLNVRPFLESTVADYIIIFDTTRIKNGWNIRPVFLSDRIALSNDNVVKKSNFQGYYINEFNTPDFVKENNLFHFKGLHPRLNSV